MAEAIQRRTWEGKICDIMDNLDKTISIFDIASDSNESGPKGLIKKFWPTWQIEDEIGEGSYGVVYKCSNKTGTIESHSAVKIISIPQKKSETTDLSAEGMTDNEIEDYYARIADDFGNEISLMVQVKGHPNIVNIEDYRIEKKKDSPGWDMLLRMELLTPFNNYLKENNFAEDDIIKLGTDILTALEVCEKKNIVHRDIKPENIFVNDFGNFKLGDFGIAKRFESLGASHSQKGTFNYMAPEVASGTHYDSTVDIYSLGLVLYRLANNNCLPFLTPENKTSPSARKSALEKRLSGEKIPVPNCQNEALATAILKALEFNPSDRYKTASEFKKALLNAHFVPNHMPTPKGELAKEEPTREDTSCDNDETEETVRICDVEENTYETDDYDDGTVRIDDSEPATSIPPKKEKKHKKKTWVLVTCIALAIIITGVFVLSLIIDKEPYYTRVGNYIYFGSYPQSEVKSSSLQTKLTEAAGSILSWTSYDYYIEGKVSDFMKYKDVTYNSNKYRGVYFTQYRPYLTSGSSSSSSRFQDDNGYYTNTIYWFKYEPIKWKILEKSNGDAFLVADMLLDSQDYNHTENNNYANSSIRSWLNSTFYNTAFNSTEQGKIKTTNVDNSVASTGYSSNSYACSNTNDKIFLLSYKEVTNSSYGFGSESSRVKKLTSYAKAQGACSNSGAGWWWLRSPFSSNSDCARGVFNDGNVDFSSVYDSTYGFAPALHLTL